MTRTTRHVWRNNGHLDIEERRFDADGHEVWAVIKCYRKDDPMPHIDPLHPTDRADWIKARKNELDAQIDLTRAHRAEYEYGSARWDYWDKEIDCLLAEKDALTAADGVPTDEEVITRRVEELGE